MSKFICVEHQIGAPGAMSDTGTSQLWPLGYIARAEDKQTGASSKYCGVGEFMYVAGSTVTALGQFVMISQTPGSAVAPLLASASSASRFPVGIAAGVLSATSVFGWVQIGGVCDYAQLGSSTTGAAGVPLYGCATAGAAVSVSSAGQLLQGCILAASHVSSQYTAATVQLERPMVMNNTAALG